MKCYRCGKDSFSDYDLCYSCWLNLILFEMG